MANITATVNSSKLWSDVSIYSGGVKPTSSDNVILVGNGTLGLDEAPFTKDFDSSAFTGTINFNSKGWNLYGSFTLGNSNTLTNSCLFTLLATTGTYNWDTKSLSTQFSITMNCSAAVTYNQQSAYISTLTGASSIHTFSGGTWNTNNYNITVSCNMFFLTSSIANMTFNPGTSVVDMTTGSPTYRYFRHIAGTNTLTSTFASSELKFKLVSSNTTSGIITTGTHAKITVTGNNITGTGVQMSIASVATLDINVDDTTRIAVTSSTNITVTGNATINGYSANKGLLFQDAYITNTPVAPIQRTITVNGTLTASNVRFRNIIGAGSASWNLSAITGGSGDCGGNSGITFTSQRIRYWVGNGGSTSDTTHIATSTGGVGNDYLLPQDTVKLDENSFNTTGQTVTVDMIHAFTSIDSSLATNSPTISLSNNVVVQGNCDFSGFNTFTHNNNCLYFYNQNTDVTLKTKIGADLYMLQIWAKGTNSSTKNAVTFQNNITFSGGIYFERGTLNINGNTITALFCRNSLTSVAYKEITVGNNGRLILTGTGNVLQSLRDEYTAIDNTGGGTFEINNATGADKTIDFKTVGYSSISTTINLGNVYFSGTGALTFSNSLGTTQYHFITIANLRAAIGTTIKLPDCTSYNQKLTFDSFTFEGTTGTKCTLTSTANTSIIDISASKKALSRVLDAGACNVSNINCLTINTLYGVGTNSGNTNYYNQAAGRTKYKFFGASNKIRSQFKSTEFNKYK